jgi:hypothetical protein
VAGRIIAGIIRPDYESCFIVGKESTMLRTAIRHLDRARYLAYAVLMTAFTLLATLVTVRFAWTGGGAFETVLLTGLTLLLAFGTRRCYRRFRAAANADE